MRYCSPECYRIGRWGGSRTESRACVTCGKSFTTFRSNGNVVCSRACDNARKSATMSGDQSILWRGGRTYPYVGTWKRQRALVRERDKGICRDCGSTDRPQVHHVLPARYGGTHDLTNLVTLCRSCHSKEELRVNAAFRAGLRNSRWAVRKTKTPLDAV